MFMNLNGYWMSPSQACRLKRGRCFRLKFLHLVLSVRAPLAEQKTFSRVERYHQTLGSMTKRIEDYYAPREVLTHLLRAKTGLPADKAY